MKDSDYIFGETLVTCNGGGCREDITIDGFDGHPLPYSDINVELKREGWISKKEDGDWIDLCEDCQKEL